MANANTFAEILEMVQNLSPLVSEAALGNGTRTSNAPLSALPSSANGGTLQTAAGMQLLTVLRHAGFSSSMFQGIGTAAEQSQYCDLQGMSRLPPSVLQSCPGDLIQHCLYTSNLVHEMFPTGLLQSTTNSMEATERPNSELLRLASQLVSLDVDLNSQLMSTTSPDNGTATLTTNLLLRMLQQEMQQRNAIAPPMATRPPVQLASSSLINSGSTIESSTHPSSTNKKKQPNKDPPAYSTLSQSTDSHKSKPVVPFGTVNAIKLPCRSRGMPKDHNFNSAHFIIPPGLRHGENMVCSHKRCRDSGVKFRYCATCQLPVAKRNFNQRHSHQSNHNSSNSSNSLASVSSPNNVSTVEKRKLETEVPVQTKKRQNAAKSTICSSNQSDTMSRRKRQWNDLLDRRPTSTDQSSVSSWLQDVITLSDIEIPSHPTVTSSNTKLLKPIVNRVGIAKEDKEVYDAGSRKVASRPASNQSSGFASPIQKARQLSSKRRCQAVGKASRMERK